MSEQLLSDSRRSHECFLNISEIQLRLLQAVLLDGHVLVYRVDKQKLHLVRRIFLGEESGCHQVLFHQRWLLIPCLKRDKVFIFEYDGGCQPAGELTFPAGTGPRHGVFTADHTRFYLVSETSNQLFTYAVNGAAFTLTSNRGSDSLVCRLLEADGRVGRELSRLQIPQCVSLSLEDRSK